VFEYGARSGSWRLLRIFKRFGINISVFGVVRALELNPELTRAFMADGHEILSHGYRWLDYTEINGQTEREDICRGVEAIERLTGEAPVGWFNGRPSINTRPLLVEHGGFLYNRDYLGDELPFWTRLGTRHHFVIPSSFETNDNRFDRNLGLRTADGFARCMMDCFDLLCEEGAEHLKLMAVNLHDRLIGRPAKAVGLIKFLEHATNHDRVWFCTCREVAEHWRRIHPPV
jgi:allantoinase